MSLEAQNTEQWAVVNATGARETVSVLPNRVYFPTPAASSPAVPHLSRGRSLSLSRARTLSVTLSTVEFRQNLSQFFSER